jgi:hypothetical protein
MDITTLIVGLILGVFAIVSGTLEFLERIGLPPPLQKVRDNKNKRIVLDTLHARFVARQWRLPHLRTR